MDEKDPITSAFARLLRLGGLAGRVGASALGSHVAGMGRSEAERQRRRLDNLVLNAARIVSTLGELKGAAMKIGQMLSLHEGLLPPEVSAVLRELQSSAPSVPFEVMEAEVRSQLADYDDLFEELEPVAFAAASIGQVHRGRLRDGRLVAVKIKYPEIDRIVEADLENLRRVLQGLFALVSEADFDAVWEEVRERLLEELDYEHEARNARTMAELHADVPELIVPGIIEEATTRNVLTMSYAPGISAEQACSDEHTQQERDRWGGVLFEMVLRSLLVHRLIHADPNLGNFAFREDGRVVVYDFGCLKRVPEKLVRGYARLTRATMEDRRRDIPEVLLAMGVLDEAGGPLGCDLTDPYVDEFGQIFRESPLYRFGEDDELYSRLLDAGLSNWSQQMDVRFPKDIVFVQRALTGHVGNLCRLRVAGPWRELALRYVEPQ